MAFFRRTVVVVDFDLYRNDGTFLEHLLKEEEVEPVEYSSKEEAERLDGTLEEWANKVAKLIALVGAYRQVGVDESEIPEDFMGINYVEGPTFNAREIRGLPIAEETREYYIPPPTPPPTPPPVPPVPEFVLQEIVRLEARKRRVAPEISAVIQFEIDELKRRYGIK